MQTWAEPGIKLPENPGKLRKDHEEKHKPHVPDESQGANILKSTLSHEDDDMLCYQRSLLDYGMLVLNFLDSISEGDGERVVRCWKFFSDVFETPWRVF